MISFADGPARSVAMHCRRAPVLLRVVRDDKGRWDALDQLTDRPRTNERVWVYRRIGKPGWVHTDYQDKAGRRRGETRAVACYELDDAQPPDAVVRDNEAWKQWAEDQRQRLAAAGIKLPQPKQEASRDG